MSRLQTILLAHVLIGVCSCGFESTPNATTPSDGPPSFAPINFEDAPSYARCMLESGEGDVAVHSSFKPEIHMSRYQTVNDDLEETATGTIVTGGHPQGLHVTRNGVGTRCLIVVCVDYETDVSLIDLYLDSDSDGLPDAAGRSNITTIPSTNVSWTAYSDDDDVLYLADGLGDKIYRLSDSNADGIPDAGTLTEFVSPGGVAGQVVDAGGGSLTEPTDDSVVLCRAAELNKRRYMHEAPAPFVLLTDTDANGVADSANDNTPGEPLHGSFDDGILAGADSVSFTASQQGTYQIRAYSTPSTFEVLGSVTGLASASVALTRQVLAGEVVVLFDLAGNAGLQTATVQSISAVRVTGFEELMGRITPGRDLKVLGDNFVGTETIRAVTKDDPATWIAVPIVSYTSTELVIDCPDPGTPLASLVIFEVLHSGDKTARLSLRVSPP